MRDIDALDPQPVQIKLASGLPVVIERLRMRQLFKLLRIVTHGAGQVINRLSTEDSQEEFTRKLITMVIFAIPDAEDETLDFIQSVTRPDGLAENRELNKQDKERNDLLWAQLSAELYNPDPNDFFTIVEAVIKSESEDLQALGKRIVATFKMAQKTGQVPNESDQKSQAPSSSEESPKHSISSLQSMAGQMNPSQPSVSEEPGSV